MKVNPTWIPRLTAAPDPQKTLDDGDLILRWFNFPPYHDEPKIWHLSATLNPADARVEIDPEDGDTGEIAGGSSLDLDRALVKLAGESVERYATTRNVGDKSKDLKSWNDLMNSGLRALDPVEISISNELKPKYRRSEKVVWLEGFELQSWETTYIPEQLIFVPHIFIEGESVWRAPISTGAAAYSSIEGALYAGLCEVIERDAFQVAWLRQLKLTYMDIPKGKTPAHQLLIKLLKLSKRYQLRCELYRIPCSLPLTVCMAIIWDDTGIGPPCAVAAKCSPSVVMGCLGALEEAYQMRSWLRRLLDTFGPYLQSKPINTLTDRARHWLAPESAKVLANWVKQANGDSSKNSKTETLLTLSELIDAVSRDGGIPYAVNLTSRLPAGIQQLGWHSIKVVFPQYQPLNLTEEMEEFALERLDNAENRLSVEAFIPKGKRHQYPHPFL
jgi:ribosomal protein S12 methylthiotransferase accessory factor